jgi:hypothetical protein
VHSGRAAADQGWRYRVLTIAEPLLISAGGEHAKAGFRSAVVINDPDFRRQLSVFVRWRIAAIAPAIFRYVHNSRSRPS